MPARWHELLATYRAVHANYLVHAETIRKELEQYAGMRP